MAKRKVIFGTYNTAQEGAWTVAGLELSSPAFQSNLVSIPGRDGLLDLSAALTGEPRYLDRTLTVTLEISDGDRAAREAQIRKIVNQLDGLTHEIYLPDDSMHYLRGRVHVVRNYNDLAHGSVTVTATCDPWLYNRFESSAMLNPTSETSQTTATLNNAGRKTVTPVVEVSEGATFNLTCGESSWSLSAGTYLLPDFYLVPGETTIQYSGKGKTVFKYREAVLL